MKIDDKLKLEWDPEDARKLTKEEVDSLIRDTVKRALASGEEDFWARQADTLVMARSIRTEEEEAFGYYMEIWVYKYERDGYVMRIEKESVE